MPLIPTFTIRLNQKILHRLVCVGKFDGKRPSIAFAASPDHVLIHNPYANEADLVSPITKLSINRKISALASADLQGNGHDYLLVGTHSNLLAYNVEDNSDVFYKDVPDGVNVITSGRIAGGGSGPLAIIGGNCSIQGFDYQGKELFWTVCGDNVTAMAFYDSTISSGASTGSIVSGSTGIGTSSGNIGTNVANMVGTGGGGIGKLIVGAEDSQIRIFDQERVEADIQESDVITGLHMCNFARLIVFIYLFIYLFILSIYLFFSCISCDIQFGQIHM